MQLLPCCALGRQLVPRLVNWLLVLYALLTTALLGFCDGLVARLILVVSFCIDGLRALALKTVPIALKSAAMGLRHAIVSLISTFPDPRHLHKVWVIGAYHTISCTCSN